MLKNNLQVHERRSRPRIIETGPRLMKGRRHATRRAHRCPLYSCHDGASAELYRYTIRRSHLNASEGNLTAAPSVSARGKIVVNVV